jgi:hypothetical protein
MEPTPNLLTQLDAAINALDVAFARACDTFEILRGGGIGPALDREEDEDPLAS